MDNSFIRIKGYRITGDDNDYVYFTDGTKIDFDKNNCIVSYFDKSSYDFVCFEFSEMRGAEWYVPYSLIGWSRSPEHKGIVIDNDNGVCPATFANHVHVIGTPEEDDEVETVEAYVLYFK